MPQRINSAFVTNMSPFFVRRGDFFTGIPDHSVHLYGATGDGTTDDTAAIQAAIDEADEHGGGVVNIPFGNYYVSSTIDVPSNVFIVGAGYDSVLQTDQNERVLRFTSGVSHAGTHNLRIYGGLANTADPSSWDTHTGIYIDNASDIFLDRVWVHGFGKQGIGVNGSSASDNTVLNFTNIVAFDNLTGIFVFRGTNQLLIQGAHCYRSGRWGIIIDDGTTGSSAYQPKNHTITGCFTHDNTIGGILLEGSKYTSVISN